MSSSPTFLLKNRYIEYIEPLHTIIVSVQFTPVYTVLKKRIRKNAHVYVRSGNLLPYYAQMSVSSSVDKPTRAVLVLSILPAFSAEPAFSESIAVPVEVLVVFG